MNRQLECRTEIILRHLNDLVTRTTVSWETLAHDIFTHYQRTVPAEFRHYRLSTHPDPHARLKAWGQKVRRLAHGGEVFRVELEDSVIQALPPDRRRALINELCALWGVVAVDMPTGDDRPDFGRIATMSTNFGQTVTAFNEVAADGKQDKQDVPALRRLIIEGRELAADGISVSRWAERVLAKVVR